MQIVDRDKATNRVKVHYIGYLEGDDEWVSCTELKNERTLGQVAPCYVPSESSLEDRAALFCDRLRRKIKLSLFATKRESPEVRVEQEIEQDVYDSYFKKVGEVKHNRGRAVHCVDSPCDPGLVELLGEKWYERIY